MKCSDLIDDDITDDVKCVKRILNHEGFKAWGIMESCLSTSKEIVIECFGNVLELDAFFNSENKTSKVIENESTLTNNGTLVVEFIDLMIESIKSFNTDKTSSKNHLIINNYFVFNINGNEVKKIKLVSEKTQQVPSQST